MALKHTQARQVLKHLRSGKTLSQAQAWSRWHIACLAERIRDLRLKGYPITTTMVSRKRDGVTRRWAEYSLEQS